MGNGLEKEQAEPAITELLVSGQWVQLESGTAKAGSDLLVAPAGSWDALTMKALQELDAFHKVYPLRSGMPREALKSRLKLLPRIFTAAVRHWVDLLDEALAPS